MGEDSKKVLSAKETCEMIYDHIAKDNGGIEPTREQIIEFFGQFIEACAKGEIRPLFIDNN